MVAHPTKPQSDKGKLIEPTFYDVKGGGEFYDMSPHGILVHRDYDQGLVKVKALKVNYGWNVNNGRYTKIKEGNPTWDNSNWLDSKNNPFEITKSLDIEFEKLSQSSEEKLQF